MPTAENDSDEPAAFRHGLVSGKTAPHDIRRGSPPAATLPAEAEADAAFRALYADPVRVNGTEMPVAALVQRARALQAAFDHLDVTVDQQVEAPGVLVMGFRMRGRHVGPLETPAGVVPATGRDVEVRTIDILTLRAEVVTEVYVVADELGRLVQLGALALADRPG